MAALRPRDAHPAVWRWWWDPRSGRPAGCSTVREVWRLKMQVSHCSKDFWTTHYPHSWALSQECNWSPRTIECERKDVLWCQIPWPTRPESTEQVLGFCSRCWLGPYAWPHTPNLFRQKPPLQSLGSCLLWPIQNLLPLTTTAEPFLQGSRFRSGSHIPTEETKKQDLRY